MRKLLLLILLLDAAALLLSGYAGVGNPNTWSWLSLVGYAFPLMLMLTLALLAVCALCCKRLLPIPIVALLLAYNAATLYCPLHHEQETPDDSFTLLSFNSFNWSKGWMKDGFHDTPRELLEFLVSTHADVICLQEATIHSSEAAYIDTIVRPVYQYVDTVQGRGASSITLFSKFPITRKQHIDYETRGNVSGAFWLDIRGRQTIIVGNHLQTTGISMANRRGFSSIMHGEQMERQTLKTTSRTILGNILTASRQRADQVDSVALFISRYRELPIIVCGDFNDIPQSYTHYRLTHPDADTELTDCYAATAWGPGYTFRHYAMRVRIDNILCSAHFTPYNCTVIDSVQYSDHNPIISQLSFTRNP